MGNSENYYAYGTADYDRTLQELADCDILMLANRRHEEVEKMEQSAGRKVTVQVRIMGESFLITGGQSEELVVSLAKELDEKLGGARKLMPSASAHRVAISVSLEQLAEIRTLRRKVETLLEAFEKS